MTGISIGTESLEGGLKILHGTELAIAVRSICEQARKRLWLAAPYIGGLATVRCLTGKHWLTGAVRDLRVLVDIEDPDFLNTETLRAFARHGRVRSLRGLHAKLYVGDGKAVFGSANLTHTAFAKRYEVCAEVTGDEARQVVDLFEAWWGVADDRSTSIEALGSLRRSERRGNHDDEHVGSTNLKTLWRLPKDPGDADIESERPSKTQSPHARFWQAVAAKFNALDLVVAGTPFHVNQRRPWSYLQIPVGTSFLHYEWEVRKRPGKQIDVALHFEHDDLKQNLRLLEALRSRSGEIGKGQPWPFSTSPWGKHWASALYAIPYANEAPVIEEVPAVVEAMKTLIERTWPTIKPLLRGHS